MKIRAEVLPSGGNQDVPDQVKDCGNDIGEVEEVLKYFPQGFDIDDFSDVVLPGYRYMCKASERQKLNF